MFFFKKKPAHTITVLPHPTACPQGDVVPAIPGKSIVECLLDADVEISHSCQMQCSCTTCHVYVMEGAAFVNHMGDEENRVLNQASDRAQWSRLGCQAYFEGNGNLVIEIRG